MKKVLTLVLALAMILGLGVPAFAFTAQLSTQNLTVDGEPVECEKYNIDGSNYFKLRDLAQLLNGTGSQFDVGWDSAEGVVDITTQHPYTSPNGTELVVGADQSDTAQISAQTIKIDGVVRSDLTVYNIGKSNFFKLREMGDALGFDVDYSKETNTAIVTSREAPLPQPQTSIVLDVVEFTLEIGGTLQLTATVVPEGTEITWTSSDPSVAAVDGSGLVTAVSSGNTVIIASAGDVKAACAITVRSASLTLNAASISLKIGESIALVAVTQPEGLPVTWSSSDPSVATVDGSGVVTAVSSGSTTIIASTGNAQAVCVVTVESASLTLNAASISLKAGESKTLTATTDPAGLTVSWSSEDTSIAIVDAQGRVTAVKGGETTIVASAAGVKAYCKVTVDTSIVFTGTGDKVISGVNLPAGNYYAEVMHDGSRNFISKLYYGDGKYDYQSLSNEIGKYAGHVDLNELRGGVTNGVLEVKADGKWMIAFKPVTGTTTTNITGKGCIVTGVFTAKQSRYVVTMSHKGSHNFIAKLVQFGGTSKYDYVSLVNEIGDYTGEKVINLKEGEKYYFFIRADGNWSFDLGEGDAVTNFPAIQVNIP